MKVLMAGGDAKEGAAEADSATEALESVTVGDKEKAAEEEPKKEEA